MASVLDFAKKNLGLASDPKLNFRSITLTHLHSSKLPIPLNDNAYWSSYYTVFDFPSDVPTLISLGELRKAIRLQPQNIVNLVKLLVSKLDTLVHSETTKKALVDRECEERGRDESFSLKNLNPAHHSNSFASQLKGFGQKVPATLFNGAADIVGVGGSNRVPKGPLREILNCVRVLTRILPLLLEESTANDPTTPTPSSFNRTSTNQPTGSIKLGDKVYWINNLLWGTEPNSPAKEQEDVLNPPQLQVPQPQPQPQFVIDEDEDEDETVKLVETKAPDPLTLTPSNLPSNNQARILYETRPPLLATLIDTILDLLFLPGVCIPVGSSLNSSSRFPIWTGGVGSSQVPLDHSHSHNSAKVEVLRLLFAILSKPLYSPPHLYSSAGQSVQDVIGFLDEGDPFRTILSSPNPAFTYLSTKTSKPLLLALLCSLINTSLAPTKTAFSNPVNAFSTLANGFGRMAQGKMGFAAPPVESPQPGSTHSSPDSRRGSLVSSNSTPQYGGASATAISEGLPGWCAVILSLLLLPDPADIGQFEAFLPTTTGLNDPEDSRQLASPPINRLETNGFRLYLSKLHRPADLSFLIDNILVILMKPMTVTSQLLASDSVVGSSTLTNSFLNYGCGLSEAMLVLYLSLDCNPRLISYLISTQKISTVMIALTFICLEQKDSPKPKTGLVKLCAVTLQLLTASERKELSHIVNSKIELPIGIRAQYSVPGTLADFLIVSICSVIFSTAQVSTSYPQAGNSSSSKTEQSNPDVNFATTYTPLVLTFTNLSPYLKDLSSSASTRLCQLFLLFSTPGFLLSEEGNVRLLYYVLETFNNIIHYQMPDNPHLIYSIIKIHQRFETLATFTLNEGLKDIERARQRRQSLKMKPRSQQEPPSPRNSALGSHRVSIGDDDNGLVKPDSHSSRFDNEDARQQELEEGLASLMMTDKKGKGKMKDQARKSSLTIPLSSPSSSSEQFQVIESRKSSAAFSNSNSHSGFGSWTDLNQFVDSCTKSAQAVGKNGFIPTESWVSSWRDSLPLDTIQIMLSELKPKGKYIHNLQLVIDTQSERERSMAREEEDKLNSKPNSKAINLLRSATLLGILPKPTKRSKRGRRFELMNFRSFNLGGLNWIGSFVWSLIFIKDSNSTMGNYFAGGSNSGRGSQHHHHPHNGSGGTNSDVSIATTLHHQQSSQQLNGNNNNNLQIRLFGVKILPRRSSSIMLGLFKPFSSSNSTSPLTPNLNSNSNHPLHHNNSISNLSSTSNFSDRHQLNNRSNSNLDHLPHTT